MQCLDNLYIRNTRSLIEQITKSCRTVKYANKDGVSNITIKTSNQIYKKICHIMCKQNTVVHYKTFEHEALQAKLKTACPLKLSHEA